MKLHILLPVHSRRITTERFIKCLSIQTFKNYNLLLIDDGSTDGTADMVQEYFPDSVVLRGRGDWWWAGALQEGYRWLCVNAKDEDYCLIINDDAIFDDTFLAQGMKILETADRTLHLGLCYSQQTGLLLDHGVHVNWAKLSFEQANSSNEINCLSTRGLFLRASDFISIGGFYPRFLPHYLSDYEFTIRAHRKGYKLMANEALKLHVDQETTGMHTISSAGFYDYLSKYFSNRNPSNPLHWIAFLWLSCPQPWKIYNILRIAYRAVKSITKQMLWSYK